MANVSRTYATVYILYSLCLLINNKEKVQIWKIFFQAFLLKNTILLIFSDAWQSYSSKKHCILPYIRFDFRLFKHGCQQLKHLDVSGCKNITDKMLNKLSTSIGKLNTPCSSCNCARKNNDERVEARLLHTLRLSGCYQITDAGLR